jgi:hypothetical protein
VVAAAPAVVAAGGAPVVVAGEVAATPLLAALDAGDHDVRPFTSIL